MYLAEFLTVAVVHLFGVMSPGPDFAIVTRNSLVYSRKVGVYTSIGIALGIMVHVAYSMLGIGLLISKSILLFNVIKFIGAGYLIYLGYKSIRAKPVSASENLELDENKIDLSAIASIKIGFLTNALNPKVTLFFLALFTQVVNPYTPKVIQFLYGTEMMFITFIWFALVSLMFSNKFIKAKLQKFHGIVERATGAILIGLGIKVALASHK